MVYDHTNGKSVNFKVVVLGVGIDDCYLFSDHAESVDCFRQLVDQADLETKVTFIDVRRASDL